MSKTVDVIIPCYNEEKHIKEVLDRLSGQGAAIYVVDNGSTDSTADVVRQYARKASEVKYLLYTERRGAAACRNFGFAMGKGEVVAFVDADELAPLDFIGRLRSVMAEYDAMVLTKRAWQPERFLEKGWAAYRFSNEDRNRLLRVFKREILEQTGPWDEKLFYYEEADLTERYLSRIQRTLGRGARVFKDTEFCLAHRETAEWKDFVRQRIWQGRGVRTTRGSLHYFLPCIFPPVELAVLLRVAYDMARKKKPLHWSLYWAMMDFVGRYISLYGYFKFK